ncbi:unnamed protein product [Spodoptera littoralis]|uniref:Uncharacterized protein n=2 Tax=Spodoptera TaxID=7106 RepID=A0A9P0N676_SPOLI|nr:uncharacterized protein LOC111360383 isoform X1 [Spodoptera litura]CAB3511632.1 unnamed protein product [Spodoptera littoralis]CAH1641296.1 unnamed protein product [Spodoptera littoralis]
MKDPFVKDSVIDSPARESLRNVEGCYNKNIFKTSSFANSRRALQSGADKISRTFRSVRNTFGNLSQHFRLGGRRRHRLTEPPSPCRTPTTPVMKKKQSGLSQILGRSPTKLYSPFGIETPHNRDFRMSPYMPDTPDHGLSPKRRKGVTHSWHILAKKRPRALFH